ncbi:MAG: hypothetical protein JST93_07190 [Acidobacteria bacterium]|nr:hypothetical protein [Acidobacteriota bacterium]
MVKKRWTVDAFRKKSEQQSPAKSPVVGKAADAMPRITGPQAREFAINAVQQALPERSFAVEMLMTDYQPGDHELVLNWCRQERDRELRHHLLRDMRQLWELHPQPETEVQMLLECYERGPCCSCRESVVDRLMKLSALPENLRAECAFDASDDIREMVSAQS